MAELGRQKLVSQTWAVQREGWVDEVEMEVGSAEDRHRVIRYNALVADSGRKPFLSRWFNDPVPAADFIVKVRSGYDPREEKR